MKLADLRPPVFLQWRSVSHWGVYKWSYGSRSSWRHGSAYVWRLKIVW